MNFSRNFSLFFSLVLPFNISFLRLFNWSDLSGTIQMGKKIGIIGELKDPTDGQNYTYVVNKDLTRYELLAFTEGEIAYNPLSQPFPPREKGVLEKVQAEDKTVITKGHKLGVLLTNENIPIQRTGTGVDILTTNTVFKAYLDNKEILNGTGGVLAGINPTGSCKRILETGLARRGDKADGVYSINPAGTSFDVYCDMTTDGGGWTRIIKDSTTTLNDLAKFGDISAISSTFYNNADYGIGWGTNDRYFKTYILNDSLKFSQMRVKYSGRYDNGGLGFLTIATLNGRNGYYWDEVVPNQGNTILRLLDGHGHIAYDFEGQSLSVNGVNIFILNQINIFNREDRLTGNGRFITMTGYYSSTIYNKRYLNYLYIR